MPLYTSVSGGTGAGRKAAPKNQYPHNWTCPDCEAHNKHYWLKCPNCGHRRPEVAR